MLDLTISYKNVWYVIFFFFSPLLCCFTALFPDSLVKNKTQSLHRQTVSSFVPWLKCKWCKDVLEIKLAWRVMNMRNWVESRCSSTIFDVKPRSRSWSVGTVYLLADLSGIYLYLKKKKNFQTKLKRLCGCLSIPLYPSSPCVPLLLRKVIAPFRRPDTWKMELVLVRKFMPYFCCSDFCVFNTGFDRWNTIPHKVPYHQFLQISFASECICTC